ncbi:hypothetical protein PLESTM_000164600 [Pleodorina starrii]|nr:hypothetical protein PLESTM_000164600 [Pleodorina starrii]
MESIIKRAAVGGDPMQAAKTKWEETSWEPGKDVYKKLAQNMPTDVLICELFSRLSETDAALSSCVDDQAELAGRVEALQSTSSDTTNRVQALEMLSEAFQADHRAMKEAVLQRRMSCSEASTSDSPSSAPKGDADLGELVLKNLTKAQLQKLQGGVWSDVLGPGSGEFGARYLRCWQSSSGRWSAVVGVDPHKRIAFTKLLSKARQEGWTSVVVTPYLSTEVMELRRQRTEVFRSLINSGFSPKWSGQADIRYSSEGKSVLYDF